MHSSDDMAETPRADDPAPEDGGSALLLDESLIHGLIAAQAIDRAQAIEIVNVAIDVKLEIGHQRGDDLLTAETAARSLIAIEHTLRSEQPPAI